jgi:cell division protein FtsB
MIEFQEKRRLKRFLYSKFTLIVLIIFIGFLLNAVWGVYQKQRLAKDNSDKVATALESLQGREETLSEEIGRLKQPSGIEEEIRKKYGLVKPGEEVIMIVSKDGEDDPATSKAPVSFWQKMLNWFK